MMARLLSRRSRINLHDQIDLAAKVDECIRTKKTVEITELLFDARFLHIYFTPIIDAKNAIGTVILIQDETEEKVMQRSKEEFFSIASHELRTPLTAIRGNTTMIQQYYPEVLQNPELKEMVDDIHNSSIRLIEIVNDFLDASRLEQGKVEFKKERFNIDKIIESVVYEMAGVSKEKGVYVKASNDLGVLPDVSADQDKVKQVIYNLVGNAMKFTEKGGITITARPEKDLLKVYIEDTGRGIPADKQSLLFHKFQQAGESLYTRDTTRGTGLGLYISKLLTENMGGKITLEHSEEGKGTSFSFSLPLATDSQQKDSDEEPTKAEGEDKVNRKKSKKS
jgi:signal transduction histidine kinase